MSFYIFKILFTGILVLIITEVAKINTKVGGVITALPIMTFLVIFWLHIEGVSDEKISDYMKSTLYFILPTLPMFIIFPFLIDRIGFTFAVISSVLLIGLSFFVINFILQRYNFLDY